MASIMSQSGWLARGARTTALEDEDEDEGEGEGDVAPGSGEEAVAYPLHWRPVRTHRWQCGFPSSHLMRRILYVE